MHCALAPLSRCFWQADLDLAKSQIVAHLDQQVRGALAGNTSVRSWGALRAALTHDKFFCFYAMSTCTPLSHGLTLAC